MNPNHIGTNFDDFLKEEGIMTDNITKLYELAGVEIPKSLASMCWAKEVLFTAEKQLELIKFIVSPYLLHHWVDDDGYVFETRLYPTDRYISYTHKDYTQALAGFVIKLVDHTSDPFRKEIKRILQ